MYAGLPATENALDVLEGLPRRHGAEEPGTPPPDPDLAELGAAGRATMQALHAERAAGGYAAPGSAAAALYEIAIEYGYGAIWGRPGLDRRQRMICSLAAFTALGLAWQQRKFLGSAMNAGLSREQVIEIVMQTAPYSGLAPALNALGIVDEVLG